MLSSSGSWEPQISRECPREMADPVGVDNEQSSRFDHPLQVASRSDHTGRGCSGSFEGRGIRQVERHSRGQGLLPG